MQAAKEAGVNDAIVAGLPGFYRAMSLFRLASLTRRASSPSSQRGS
jgi:hypothetical protein